MVFRYPGGKTKLLPVIAPAIDARLKDVFVDVFVGGGSVLIDVARRHPKVKLVANDLDPHIYAFWHLFEVDDDKYFDTLFTLMARKPSIKLFNTLRAAVPSTEVERAYYAIFFNRTTFSGIYDSGPIGGQSQTSRWKIYCRYNAIRLIAEVKELRTLFRGRLRVTNKPWQEIKLEKDYCYYLDPPYFEKGSCLYQHSMPEHEHRELAAVLNNSDSWILSYDNHKVIKDLYTGCNCQEVSAKYSINGIKTAWKDKTELLITK